MDFNLNIGAFSAVQKAVPMEEGKLYDVIIIGGGPAAMTAAVYCMRKGVSAGLISRDIGGQVSETAGIENYLGYKYIEGRELVDRFAEQVKQFGIGLREADAVTGISDGKVKSVLCKSGKTFQARAVIIASGNRWRHLGVPGEAELTGRGVAYCAICDAPLFAGKKVAVVGGGNTGVEAAIDLAKAAEKVVVVQNLAYLTADRVLIDAMGKYQNVETFFEHEVREIKGNARVEGLVVADKKTGSEQVLDVAGVFVSIGLIPNADMVKGMVKLTPMGEIVVDCACRSSVPGIFAAGDVTSVPYKQIIIAAGEGAKAALSACDYVLKGE